MFRNALLFIESTKKVNAWSLVEAFGIVFSSSKENRSIPESGLGKNYEFEVPCFYRFTF